VRRRARPVSRFGAGKLPSVNLVDAQLERAQRLDRRRIDRDEALRLKRDRGAGQLPLDDGGFPLDVDTWRLAREHGRRRDDGDRPRGQEPRDRA